MVARGEWLEHSFDTPPGRRAAEQGVGEHALFDLESRAVVATVDVHGHDQIARSKLPPSSIQRSACRSASSEVAVETACNAVRG